ncbi:hypothetical protein L1887_13044 [Cichorium endivia]|nr:hypothetical protein L1887_13044 [Cichorium endivia]
MAGITRSAMVQTSRTLCARSLTSYKPTQVRCLASQPPLDAAKRGVEEVKKVGNQIKDQVSSHAENLTNQSKDAAGKVSEAAEKAKTSAQDAWNVATEKAQKVKDNVSEKAEEAADVVKQNVDAAKRKIN